MKKEHYGEILNQNEKAFAKEMAELLNDRDALPLYEFFVSQYSETFLREILEKVRAIPDRKIRKTRGALFNYLVQQHANARGYYPRD